MNKKIPLAIVFAMPFFLLVSFQKVGAISGACSWHGGINCVTGPTLTGGVACNDGWQDSSVMYYSPDTCFQGDFCNSPNVPLQVGAFVAKFGGDAARSAFQSVITLTLNTVAQVEDSTNATYNQFYQSYLSSKQALDSQLTQGDSNFQQQLQQLGQQQAGASGYATAMEARLNPYGGGTGTGWAGYQNELNSRYQPLIDNTNSQKQIFDAQINNSKSQLDINLATMKIKHDAVIQSAETCKDRATFLSNIINSAQLVPANQTPLTTAQPQIAFFLASSSTSSVPVIPQAVQSTATSSSVLKISISKNLSIGSSGQDVITLQRFLEGKDFLTLPSGTKKGYFGTSTKKALGAFQKSVGLPTTGTLGPLTRQLINNL